MKPKESWGRNTYTRQNKLQNKKWNRNKEECHIVKRLSIQKEGRTFINICALNTKEPEDIKQILTHISRKY